jgi:protein-tyrosine phosphatase
MNESPLPNRGQLAHHEMMDDTVPEVGREDLARLSRLLKNQLFLSNSINCRNFSAVFSRNFEF